MDVIIGTAKTVVRAVDSDSLVSPQIMEQILRVVLAAVQQEEEHRMRIRAEQQVTSGVWGEQGEVWV